LNEWIELRARGPLETKDLAALFIVNASASGGVIDDTPEGDTRTGRLTFFLPPAASRGLAGLRKKLGGYGWGFKARPYADVDWSERWKRFIRPARAGVFFVRPSWHEKKGRQGGKRPVEIVIDPGMAFGTGTHPTTRMSLRAISVLFAERPRLIKPGEARLLDVGAGSGILSIAAKKLGLKCVLAIDIDSDALCVARKNARLNRVSITLSPLPIERVRGRFEAVIANIQSGVLLGLLPHLTGRLAPGGFLVLSGILAGERAGVRSAFQDGGLRPVKTLLCGEWATLIMRRPEKR